MEELSRLILLVLAAVLVMQLASGGPQQVRDWLAAKFLGRPKAG